LDDGAALFLTVANYYNADGKSILEEGVAPTEVVRTSASAADDSDEGEGEDVTTTPGTPKDTAIGPRPLSSEDPVLRRALELLNGPVKKAA
jgi:C-terminal processing protease CtpA/Prc